MAYYDADGNEVTAFSQEEVEAQKAEALKTANEELENLKKEKDALSNKDINFANLKESISKKDEEIKSLSTKIEEVNNGRITEMQNDVLNRVAGDDKDLRESIMKEMDTFRDKPTTKEGMKDLALKALAIVKPAMVSNAMDDFKSASFGNGFRNIKATTETEIKPELKTVASNMNISDEDWKKYGGAK